MKKLTTIAGIAVLILASAFVSTAQAAKIQSIYPSDAILVVESVEEVARALDNTHGVATLTLVNGKGKVMVSKYTIIKVTN